MTTPDVSIAKWAGPPASYTKGRRSGQPSVIVIHTTEGSEGPASAEDGAAYDRRRTDGTSTHFFVDSNSIVQEVLVSDEAHAARTHGNDIGIQIEICGHAAQSGAQWADAASAPTIENVARLCVALRKKYGTGRFPLARLSGSKLRAAWNGGGTRGFCGHVDITRAFPEDKGTHEDPGPNFPWSKLFARISQLESQASAAQEDDDVTPAQFTSMLLTALKDKNVRSELAEAILNEPVTDSRNPTGPKRALVSSEVYGAQEAVQPVLDKLDRVLKALTPPSA